MREAVPADRLAQRAADQRAASGPDDQQVARLVRDVHQDRAGLAAFEAGLGGVPDDVEIEPCVERGETGPVLVDIADRPDDLLIIGTGRRSLVGRALRKSVGRYCLAHAKCPVLAVPPSALMDEMRHGLRPWSLRGRHALVSDISELTGN